MPQHTLQALHLAIFKEENVLWEGDWEPFTSSLSLDSFQQVLKNKNVDRLKNIKNKELRNSPSLTVAKPC